MILYPPGTVLHLYPLALFRKQRSLKSPHQLGEPDSPNQYVHFLLFTPFRIKPQIHFSVAEGYTLPQEHILAFVPKMHSGGIL